MRSEGQAGVRSGGVLLLFKNVENLPIRSSGLGFRVLGLGFRVLGLGVWV